MATKDDLVRELRQLFDDQQKKTDDALQQRDERIDELQAQLARIEKIGGASGAGDAPRFSFPTATELKAQSIGSDPAGGYLVEATVGPFFDRLRARNVVLASGVRVVDFGQSDRLELPGLSASTTVERSSEGGTLSGSDLTLQRVVLYARKYVIRTVGSSEWFEDSSPSGREIVTDDHERQLAAALDYDFLIGSTAGSLVGMANTPGITSTELGAGNGSTLTLADVEALLYRLERQNANIERVAIFMSPRGWSTLRKQLDDVNRYMVQPDVTSAETRRLFGRPVYVSSQLPIDQVVGGSSDCETVIAADVDQVVVGRRVQLSLLYDPYSLSSTDRIVIQSRARFGFGVLNVGAVQTLTGCRA